jgi:peptide/nickel transport system permease protein
MPKTTRFFIAMSIIILWLLLTLIPWQLWIDSGMNLSSMLSGPSVEHPFGTDSLGRDLLLNFASAIHDSVLPLWINVFLFTILGYGFGVLLVVSEDFHKIFSPLSWGVQAASGMFLSIPVGILVFLLANYLERAGIWSIIGALCAFSFFRSLLMIFELYTQDEKLGYWKAHQSIGGGLWNRIWKYGICKSWKKVMLGNLAFNLSMAISIEAALSYLGFGVQPPKLSFGNILSAHYDQFLKGHLSIMFFTVGALALCYLVPVALMRVLSRPALGDSDS